MADMIALRRASHGNPDQLIAVSRKLLQDVYARIAELEAGEGVSQSHKARGAMAPGKSKNNANPSFATDDAA